MISSLLDIAISTARNSPKPAVKAAALTANLLIL
jgi:hypothetical protein